MFELKPLSREAIPAALAKAERYRLLNESAMAESICEDILAADADNQQAIVMLILALSDQFRDPGVTAHTTRARGLLPGLRDEDARLCSAGITAGRGARAPVARGGRGVGAVAQGWFSEAMGLFERAIAVRPAGNDDAVLRWNACARTLER